MSRHRMLLAAVLVVAFALTPLAPPARAYNTGVKWQTHGFLSYQVSPNLDRDLAVTNASANIADAADRWNQPSQLTLAPIPWSDPPGPRAIFAANLTNDAAGCGTNSDFYAVVCIYPSPNGLNDPPVSTQMYLNSDSAHYSWNTLETPESMRGGSVFPRVASVYVMALHEFGHMMELRDYPANHGEAVMWFDETAKLALTEDDKQGMLMLHAPRTGWEYPDPQGQINRAASPPYYTGGYNQGLPVELGPVGPENINGQTIQPHSGGRQVRLAGSSVGGYAYAYQTLFTSEDDSTNLALTSRNYVTIQQGMNLHWCQYNLQQATMSVDFEAIDGAGNVAALRDSGTTDQYGVPVHPSFRGQAGPAGQYNCYDADISRLAGRKITRWMIAYDNGNNGAQGQFRAYFDDLRLDPPGPEVVTYTTGTGSVSASPPGPSYDTGTLVTFTATPGSNSIFTGWTVDGRPAGWANPLTVTMNTRHSIVGNFGPRLSFSDVPSGATYANAVTQLAARGIIKGCDQAASPPLFCPNDGTVRAQSAAFIARAIGWDLEDWGNPFPDRCDPGGQNCIDAALWRNVGTLNHYSVATGYTDPGTCTAAGTTAPCYLPRQGVLNIQVISFLTRAMIAKGYWARQADNPNLYTNVPADGTQRSDLATYVFYAGAVPDRPTSGPFTGYDQAAQRSFFAQVEWQALDSYFRVDRVP